jgi:Bifunctional DNA primase/polymerase, N-terminal
VVDCCSIQHWYCNGSKRSVGHRFGHIEGQRYFWLARAGGRCRDRTKAGAKNLLSSNSKRRVALYFTAPDQRLGTTAGKLGRHVDTRGSGGYVVGPGSVCSGRYYVVVDHAPIAPLPKWITKLLEPKPHSRPPVAPGEITSQYLRAVLQGEVERVRSARPGTRNDRQRA